MPASPSWSQSPAVRRLPARDRTTIRSGTLGSNSWSRIASAGSTTPYPTKPVRRFRSCGPVLGRLAIGTRLSSPSQASRCADCYAPTVSSVAAGPVCERIHDDQRVSAQRSAALGAAKTKQRLPVLLLERSFYALAGQRCGHVRQPVAASGDVLQVRNVVCMCRRARRLGSATMTGVRPGDIGGSGHYAQVAFGGTTDRRDGPISNQPHPARAQARLGGSSDA